MAADIFKYDIPAMPVVDEHGTLLGIVTTDDAWDAIEDDVAGDKTKMNAIDCRHYRRVSHGPVPLLADFAAAGGLAASRRPALLGGCHEREGHAHDDGRRAPGRRRERAAPGSRGDRRYGHSVGEQIGPAATKKPSKLLLVLAAMGPGVVTAMAGNDAGGISTYSTAGANFGFGTLWVIPHHVRAARRRGDHGRPHGCRHGQGGFAALIRERFGIRIAAFAMLALLVGNVATTFSEFAGIASGMEMFGVSKYISVPVAAFGVWLLVVGGSPQARAAGVPRAVAGVSHLCGGGVLAQPNWGEALHDTVVPTFVGDVSFISLVIAMIGTTIAPWMMFFSQSNVVEKGLTPKDLSRRKPTPSPAPSPPAWWPGSSS